LSELHERIRSGLEKHLDEAQLDLLLDTILSAKKSARGWCPNCKKAVNVEVADAKAVTGALVDLANRGFGTPGKASDPVAPPTSYEVGDMSGLSDVELRRLASV